MFSFYYVRIRFPTGKHVISVLDRNPSEICSAWIIIISRHQQPSMMAAPIPRKGSLACRTHQPIGYVGRTGSSWVNQRGFVIRKRWRRAFTALITTISARDIPSSKWHLTDDFCQRDMKALKALRSVKSQDTSAYWVKECFMLNFCATLRRTLARRTAVNFPGNGEYAYFIYMCQRTLYQWPIFRSSEDWILTRVSLVGQA